MAIIFFLGLLVKGVRILYLLHLLAYPNVAYSKLTYVYSRWRIRIQNTEQLLSTESHEKVRVKYN